MRNKKSTGKKLKVVHIPLKFSVTVLILSLIVLAITSSLNSYEFGEDYEAIGMVISVIGKVTFLSLMLSFLGIAYGLVIFYLKYIRPFFQTQTTEIDLEPVPEPEPEIEPEYKSDDAEVMQKTEATFAALMGQFDEVASKIDDDKVKAATELNGLKTYVEEIVKLAGGIAEKASELETTSTNLEEAMNAVMENDANKLARVRGMITESDLKNMLNSDLPFTDKYWLAILEHLSEHASALGRHANDYRLLCSNCLRQLTDKREDILQLGKQVKALELSGPFLQISANMYRAQDYLVQNGGYGANEFLPKSAQSVQVFSGTQKAALVENVEFSEN